MIPGPIEMDESVLNAVSRKATSHLDPDFIQTFQKVFHQLRDLFHADQSIQPFVIAGSGTLGWDMVATNLVQPKEDVLVISTGIFGDWFGDCLQTYQAKVTYLKPDQFGELPSIESLTSVLQSHTFTVVTLTHVDTSTAVLVPLDEYISVIRKYAPDVYLVVDAVCSAGAEYIDFQVHSIDVLLTASQKALGAPVGLSVLLVSERALRRPSRGYYLSWKKWLPIMQAYEQGRASYFATPPVSLIYALHASLACIPKDFAQHHQQAQAHVMDWVQNKMQLRPLTTSPAHTLTALYLPDSIPLASFLAALRAHGVVAAGGVYPGKTYLRLGHMGISVTQPHRQHIPHLLKVLTQVFHAFGWPPSHPQDEQQY